jgi:TPR repeat protein
MSNLGLMYKAGEGVPQDAVTAVKWFRAAAEKQDREGLNNLAVMLDQGLGTAVDRKAAMELFERAARAGEAAAAFNLALMHLRQSPPTTGAAHAEPASGAAAGRNPLIDAYSWFNVAASLGNGDAVSRRSEVASRLTAEQVAVAQSASLDLMPPLAMPVATR